MYLNKTQQDTLNDLLPQAIASKREAAVSGRSGLENMSERSEVAHNDVVVDLQQKKVGSSNMPPDETERAPYYPKGKYKWFSKGVYSKLPCLSCVVSC